MIESDPIRRLLASCDESQQRAITSPDQPLLVVANAGSGKTRVLTRRIAWMVLSEKIQGEHILALTFTRKAAAELRDRLGQLGLTRSVTTGTFHALALSQLRRRALDGGTTPPVLLDSKARLLGALVPDRPHRSESGKPVERREVLSIIASEIEWAKAQRITFDRYAERAHLSERVTALDPIFIGNAFIAYEQEKRRRRVLDFDDLLADLATAITTDANFAAAERWLFRHFFVDEFQDASPAQLHLLDAWLGGRSDLFAVGDPRQAIYGWNGADTTAITNFTSHFSNASVMHLDVNYRSTPQLVAVASAALRREDRRDLEAPRPDGAVPSITIYEDDHEEALGVARDIRRVHGPGRLWSDCAVLARTNAQLQLFGDALSKAGIPSRVGDARSFFATAEIRDAINALKHCSDRQAFRTWLDDQRSETGLGSDEDSEKSQVTSGGSKSADASDRSVFLRVVSEYNDLDPFANGPGCVAYLREAMRTDSFAHRGDAVDLLTFHRAKGLEWPFVWVTGIEEGFVPIAFARTTQALDEERRLLYVALSRAEDELRCSWARIRHFGRHASDRQPSPWMVSIENACHQLQRDSRPKMELARQALAESRAALAKGRS